MYEANNQGYVSFMCETNIKKSHKAFVRYAFKHKMKSPASDVSSSLTNQQLNCIIKWFFTDLQH